VLGLAVTVVAILLLILCAYRGVNLVLVSPVLAVLAVVLTDPASALPAFTGIFMQRFADFMQLYFPTLLLGAAFGKAMEAAGLIPVIAAGVARFMGPRRAILAVVLLTALLTYGGVSVYVVAFAAYPFGAVLFREAGIPKRLLPAVLLLGGGTFTMVSLPGTPQLPNLIPIPVLGTTEWAAPLLGLVAAALMLGAGLVYLGTRAARLTAGGEGYGSGHLNEPSATYTGRTSLLLAALPLLVVIVANVALSY
jgi:H+/gluconate symporter-like permease